jgi:hypothetical protein
MKQKPIKVTLYLGEKQIQSLPEEYKDEMSKRLSERMSTFYTAHPQEFQKIK